MLLCSSCDGPVVEGEGAALSLARALGGEENGRYARAREGRAFVFPDDHGPHPEYRTEWWYVTGNVATRDGRRFGYQFTFFRGALRPTDQSYLDASPWRADQAYMAHLALTDIDANRFHAFERFARGAAGLAGARAQPLRVWLEDWRLEGLPSLPAASTRAVFDARHPPLRLRAAEGDVALDLVLLAEKPPAFHGEAGLSRKGPEEGNASRYYSYTRLHTTGRVAIGGESHVVDGTSWLDREWGTTMLSPGVVGWDWFALQLDDRSELMLYQMRREDGSASPFSAGTFVAPDGATTRLVADDIRIDVVASWTSPRSGVAYPSAWHVRVPRVAAELDVSPVLADQEMDLAVRYWEGAVTATGRSRGSSVEGVGYVELTGYNGGTSRPR